MAIKKSQLHPAKALARHLGDRLARRRRELGMTASDLDGAISAPAGSVSRLEAGGKRMDAAQLYTLSRALDVPVMYFFENSPVSLPSDPSNAQNPKTVEEAERLIDAYYKIEDTKVRSDILGLLKAAAVAEKEEEEEEAKPA